MKMKSLLFVTAALLMKIKKLLMTLVLMLAISPAVADTIDNSVGTWALDKPQNCRVPKKVYHIKSDSRQQEDGSPTFLRFVSLLGALDIERVTYASDFGDHISTVTVYSTSGEPVGTQWPYEKINEFLTRVNKN
jgi:hypothetical protein